MDKEHTEKEPIETSDLGTKYIAMIHYILLCSPSTMN
jgi:hypothetical protein